MKSLLALLLLVTSLSVSAVEPTPTDDEYVGMCGSAVLNEANVIVRYKANGVPLEQAVREFSASAREAGFPVAPVVALVKVIYNPKSSQEEITRRIFELIDVCVAHQRKLNTPQAGGATSLPS